MKKINLLVPIVLATSVSPLVSCGNVPHPIPTPEEVFNYIYKPTLITDPAHSEDDTYKDYLFAHKDDSNLFKGEIIYDLFYRYNQIDYVPFFLNSGDSFTTLCNDQVVDMKTLITKLEWAWDEENKLHVTFKGYVAFYFIKDYYDANDQSQLVYQINDFVMITYQFEDLTVAFETNASLSYFWSREEEMPLAIGIMDIKKLGKDRPLFYIKEASTRNITPQNSIKWEKQ